MTDQDSSDTPKKTPFTELEVFVSPQGDAQRVHLRPGPIPAYLRVCFDEQGEAFPAQLDLGDLHEQLRARGLSVTRCESTSGGYQLLAQGEAARDLATWLAGSFATGIR